MTNSQLILFFTPSKKRELLTRKELSQQLEFQPLYLQDFNSHLTPFQRIYIISVLHNKHR